MGNLIGTDQRSSLWRTRREQSIIRILNKCAPFYVCANIMHTIRPSGCRMVQTTVDHRVHRNFCRTESSLLRRNRKLDLSPYVYQILTEILFRPTHFVYWYVGPIDIQTYPIHISSVLSWPPHHQFPFSFDNNLLIRTSYWCVCTYNRSAMDGSEPFNAFPMLIRRPLSRNENVIIHSLPVPSQSNIAAIDFPRSRLTQMQISFTLSAMQIKYWIFQNT